MTNDFSLKNRARLASQIVSEAGGEVTGRTKLQKLVFLIELSGHGFGVPFEYKHYGPYSEELAEAVNAATLFGYMSETKERTNWGGFYSVYKISEEQPNTSSDNSVRAQIASIAVKANAVELELAATAAFLAKENFEDPWAETRLRKPVKCTEKRLAKAKELYNSIKSLSGTDSLPTLA